MALTALQVQHASRRCFGLLAPTATSVQLQSSIRLTPCAALACWSRTAGLLQEAQLKARVAELAHQQAAAEYDAMVLNSDSLLEACSILAGLSGFMPITVLAAKRDRVAAELMQVYQRCEDLRNTVDTTAEDVSAAVALLA